MDRSVRTSSQEWNRTLFGGHHHVQTLPIGTHLVHGLVRDLTEEAELRAVFQEHKARLRALNSDLGLIVWSHDV